MLNVFCVSCKQMKPAEYLDQEQEYPDNVDKTQPLPPWASVALGKRGGVYHYALVCSKKCGQVMLKSLFGIGGLK